MGIEQAGEFVIWGVAISNHEIISHQEHEIQEHSPEMREMKDMFRIPNEDVEYQPEPESLAGFFASLTDKVDELLLAANWRPNLE